MAYRQKTAEECEILAQDIADGKVWTSLHSTGLDAFTMVMMFMNEDALKTLKEDSVSVLYEYLDKAGPFSVNGIPRFTSFSSLDIDDAKSVFTRYNKIVIYKEKRLRAAKKQTS